MVSSPKNANFVINYSPSYCSKPEHKLRYFWWNTRAFWPFIGSNATTTFKDQKGSKDIVKMWHQWFNHNFMKLRERFVCKENKKSQKALRFDQKYLKLCSEDEWRSYGFGTTWGWEMNDRILTIPLKLLTAQILLNTIHIIIFVLYIVSFIYCIIIIRYLY